jgi:hypothetical protein
VLNNSILRRIFVPKKEEVRREWRKLCDEELHNLFFSPNMIVTISRRMRQTGNIVSMRHTEMHAEF